ncbi:MAG: hypothetical protein VW576_03245 [Opitutae bacterium]
MIYFNDYLDLQPENQPPLLDQDLSGEKDLINFPKVSSFVEKAEIGKYVDMLMQMPDSDCADRPFYNKEAVCDIVSHQKLAETLLDKEIL